MFDAATVEVARYRWRAGHGNGPEAIPAPRHAPTLIIGAGGTSAKSPPIHGWISTSSADGSGGKAENP